MGIKVRSNVFETNSSSSHSIAIDTTGVSAASKGATIHGDAKYIESGTFTTPDARLTALWSIILCEHPDEKEDWSARIKNTLNDYNIVLENNASSAFFASADDNDFLLNELKDDPELLRNYVLGKNSVSILGYDSDMDIQSAIERMPQWGYILFAEGERK